MSKHHFDLMVAYPEYNEETQAKFIPAMGILHNFIRIHDPYDEARDRRGSSMSASATGETHQQQLEELGFEITIEERDRAGGQRDRIAKRMWIDYQAELQRRTRNNEAALAHLRRR